MPTTEFVEFRFAGIFQHGAGLLLRQRRHDGDEKLALGVQRVDVLFLELEFLTLKPNTYIPQSKGPNTERSWYFAC